MYQAKIIHKIVMPFLLALSLFSLILGNPIEKMHTVYDDLIDRCAIIESYSDFAKGCNSNVTIQSPLHPQIEDIDNIMCVLLYKSLNTSCPARDSKIPSVPDICQKLPGILNQTAWKSLSTVFENNKVCKNLCEDTRHTQHAEICLLSLYAINQTTNKQKIDKNPIANVLHQDKSKDGNTNSDAVQPALVKEPEPALENPPQSQQDQKKLPEGDIPGIQVSQDVASQKSEQVEQTLEDKLQAPASSNTNTDKVADSNSQDIAKQNLNNNEKPKSDVNDPDDKVDDTAGDSDDPLYPNEEDKSVLKKDGMPDDGGSYPIEVDGDSYFFSYFLAVCIIFVFGYVVYHNKQKILALIVEGRQGKRQYRGRRPNSTNYHKLDSNLEEAISSSCNKNVSNIIY